MPNVFDVDDWWDEGEMWCGLHAALDPVRVPFLRHALDDLESPRVLDVGCGGGFLLRALAELGAAPVGVDVAAAALRAAASVTSALVRADGARLPFANASFDAVLLSEVLEHVAEPERVLREAGRVVRAGGIILVTVPNRTLLSRAALIDLAQRFPPTRVLPEDLHHWHRFVRPGELTAWLAAAGCSVETVQGVGLRLRHAPAAALSWWRLKRGRASYAEAGRSIPLAPVRSAALAYMVRARRHAT